MAALSELGTQASVDTETAIKLEEYVCMLYGGKGKDVDALRYEKFFTK